jgi:hypothetical protein
MYPILSITLGLRFFVAKILQRKVSSITFLSLFTNPFTKKPMDLPLYYTTNNALEVIPFKMTISNKVTKLL